LRIIGKVAVVTGGASGIGAETVRVLLREGALVAVLDRSAEAAQALAVQMRDAGADCLGLAVDVTNEQAMTAAVNHVASRWTGVDILVNCAGVALRKRVDETAESEWRLVIDVNLKGTYLACKAVLPVMRDGGAIVNLSSIAGVTGLRERAAYSASKGAVGALTRNMALDYAPRGIRVNCVCPGFVKTPMTQVLMSDPETNRKLLNTHPLGRIGEPADIANAILFLVSSEASWVTGHLLMVDGGFSAGQSGL
jgi:meso-butanediol dehydrogenase / (S,S)-butanediol dehydrogenase / diacetyl reductase